MGTRCGKYQRVHAGCYFLLSLEGKQNRLAQNFFISKQTEFVFKTQSEIVSVIKKKTREVHASIQTIIKVSRNEDKM